MEIWETWTKINGEKIDDLKSYIDSQIAERKVSARNNKHDLEIMIGTDAMVRPSSKSKKEKNISFMTVIVFKKGLNGSHVIKRRSTETYSGFVPTAVKLNGEINRTAALAFWLRENIELDPHVHLDVNPSETTGSFEVYKYIKGYFESCGFKNVEYKPKAIVASICADFFL